MRRRLRPDARSPENGRRDNAGGKGERHARDRRRRREDHKESYVGRVLKALALDIALPIFTELRVPQLNFNPSPSTALRSQQ
jgi:hypothetical protein